MLICEIIVKTILFMALVAGVFFLGWVFAVAGLISDAAFQSLDNETTYTNLIKRFGNMMQAHWAIAKRRILW